MATGTSTFIIELPLKTTPHDERELDIRFHAAQKLYNACLGEALKRLEHMWQSSEWQSAMAMPKKTEAERKARQQAFYAVRAQYKLTEYDLHAFAKEVKNACWIGQHLGINEVQKLASRAFAAVEKHSYGQAGRPRFKNRELLRSIEGKGNRQGIMWKDKGKKRAGDKVVTGARVHWDGLVMKPVLNPRDDKDGRYEAWALSCPVKSVRIVRRWVKGKRCYFVQLVLEGQPDIKERQHATGTVGVDTGPSMVAAFGDKQAALKALAPSISPLIQKKKEIQRKMDRSQRAMNPDNYKADGTVKKGRLTWVHSHHYEYLRLELREINRVIRATRDKEHGELCHCLLQLGNVFRLEKTSGKALQKQYGKAVLDCALMDFLTKLERKAARAGGGFEEFSAYRYDLSQYDHKSDTRTKKPLSQRWHEFGDGSAPVQRDLYSAFLAKHVEPPSAAFPQGTFDTAQVQATWAGAEPLLKQAVSEAWVQAHKPTQKGRRLRVPAAFGFSRLPDGWSLGQDGSLVKKGSA